MDQSTSPSKINLAVFVTAVLGAIVLPRIIRVALTAEVAPATLWAISLLFIIGVIIALVMMRRAARAGRITSESVAGFWQSAVAYILAMDMVMFGAQKLCHLQFSVPLGMLDDPFTAIPNEMLMWAFMGRYHSMVNVIACIEIGGGLLLLFRRTRLAGAFVLLPMLLNILLLDLYYLNLLVQAYAALETLAVIYLILLQYNRLVEFFFTAKDRLPEFGRASNTFKMALRVLVVMIPVMALAAHRYEKNYEEITGKYEVRKVVVDGIDRTNLACRDSLLTNVFIDRTDFVFGYTNYRNKQIGSYKYNEVDRQIVVNWLVPQSIRPDTLVATITPGSAPETRIVNGMLGKKKLRIEMVRVAPVNN